MSFRIFPEQVTNHLVDERNRRTAESQEAEAKYAGQVAVEGQSGQTPAPETLPQAAPAEPAEELPKLDQPPEPHQ